MVKTPIALVGFYQDRHGGERLLKNLRSYDIPSIWVDSRLTGFMPIDNSDYSTDGLPEVIESYKDTMLFTFGESAPGEVISFMLKKAGGLGYEYSLVLGCDEYLTGDWNITNEALYDLQLKEPARIRMPIVEHNDTGLNRGNAKHVQDRIVYLPEFVYVKGIHWLYYTNFHGAERIIGEARQTPCVYGATVNHDDTIRPAWRNQVMDVFQKKQVAREKLELNTIVKKEQDEKLSRVFVHG